jgi:hypothetical protein
MSSTESPLEMAQRHVVEAEQRIARQQALLETLKRDGHSGRIIAEAQTVAATLEESLRLAKQHLEMEQQHYGGSKKPA